MSSKKAQERSDRVFLSLFLKKNPITSVLGVCLGIGEKTFTVFVPSLGLSTRVFLDEHKDVFDMNTIEDDGRRKLVIRPKSNVVPGMQPDDAETSPVHSWKSLNVSIFTKLTVACYCKERTPIDVKVMVVGPWVD
jgi:DIS3-like exonuclease 2